MKLDWPASPLTRRRMEALIPVLLCALVCGVNAWGAEPAELLDSIRSTTLDLRRTVALRNIELEIGLAVLKVERGVLIPTRPIDGRTVEFVFIGQARFRCDPPDEIEAGQLELFTGRPFLDAPLEAAVLVITNQETVGEILARPSPLELRAGLIESAEEFHQDWLEKTERRNTGVESAIFRALVGDAAFHSYFAVWARSHELGDFVYQLDPEDAEQITVGSFVPVNVSGWDRTRLRRQLRMQQRKGRWLDVRVEDLGAWDVWLSAPWSPTPGQSLPGNMGFEARHYKLDVTIKKYHHKIEGTAQLRLEALAGGRRAVSLELFRDLQVERVVDQEGRELFSFRSGAEVVVLLAEPTRAGEELTLEVSYGGHVAKWAGRKTFDLENTATWYPHCGVVDRASYDVTLRWPKKYQLIASGRLVDSGRRGDFRWERRVLDQPALAFSFALGEFLIERRQSGRVELVMAFNRHTQWRTTPELRARALDTVEDSLRFFEDLFGPYPLDQLTLVTLPRGYSQSYPGFITLTDTVVRSVPTGNRESMEWLRADTIAHEVSHQWWGNMLGWSSYRDQWLSEGMANYSALLFFARNTKNSRGALAESSTMWRRSLTRLTLGGRTIESLGPVVLGPRLNSSLASDGYRAIVYRKGAVVLAMLARTIGEKPFLEMMRALAEAAEFHVISTEDFIAAIEHMSKLELTDFARQYIYGTGVPQVYYDYEIVEGIGGGWRVRGEAHWLAEPRYTHRLERAVSGGWVLQRDARQRRVSADSGLMVPFRVVVGGEGSDHEFIARQGTAAGTLLEGMVMLAAEQAQFEIETDARPIAFELDPLGEILAYFHPEPTYPRRVSRFRADDLMARGRLAEAEVALRDALELPPPEPVATDGIPWMSDPVGQAQRDDASIRLALARLYVRQQRVEDAQVELDAVADLLESDRVTFRVERDVLQSRLEIARGSYEPAFRRLKKTLKLAAPREGARGWRAALWKVQLASGRSLGSAGGAGARRGPAGFDGAAFFLNGPTWPEITASGGRL
jgi:hypothetical protein